MKTKSLIISAFTAMAALSSCTEDENILGSSGSQLDVSVSIPALTRAAIEGTQLPENAQLGVSLFNPDGSDYDGKQQGYKNVLYKSEILTTGRVKWSSANPIILSPSKGKAVAYYPYSAAASDISAIPVETTSQTDYLYSDWVNDLSFKNPQANFAMNHALCAVQINLINADYTAGPGEVTRFSVESPALATTASLNAKTGQLSAFAGQGDAIAVDETLTITTESQGTKIIAIPTGTQGNLTVKVDIDGATSTVPVTLSQPFVQGKAYVVNLKVKDAKAPVELVSVSVKEWTKEALGEFEIMPILVPDDKYSIEVTIPDNGKVFQSNVCEFTGTIDWGDGTEPTTHSKENNPSHTYVNAGKYTITHKGVCHTLGIYIPETGTYENKRIIQFTDITDILHIGKDLDIRKMNYAFAFSRFKELRKGILDKCTKVTTFRCAFAGNNELTSIPQGLFDKCTQATDFNATFQLCPTLTSIPKGLFDKCTKVKDFGSTFSGCSSLTSIPKGLFDSCTQATNFYATFSGCLSLTSIPQGLFDNCTQATNFFNTFSGLSLTSIPQGLFDNCTKVKDFGSTFRGCSSLTNIPKGLFDKCTKATDFGGTFLDCSSLTSIPQGLLDKCTEVTSFRETFFGCSSLTNIPQGLFDSCKRVSNFSNTFYGCVNLTGESPYTLIDGVKVHLYERHNFPDVFASPSSHAYRFNKCTNLTDYDQITSDWK